MVELVIPTMRKPALDRVVSHYLALRPELIRRIVIVDYDMSFPSSGRVRALASETGRVRHIGVHGERYFNKSRALNLGVGATSGEIILICDADVMILPTSISQMTSAAAAGKVVYLALVKEAATGEVRDGPGIVCFRLADFLAVEGYDSAFEGWGFEDRDFLARLVRLGREVVALGEGVHLSHPDSERTNNYLLRDRDGSRELNRKRFEARNAENYLLGTFTADCLLHAV